MNKKILIIPTRYPTYYQPHNYIFVEDQAKALALENDVHVCGVIPVSFKFILKLGIKGLGRNKYVKNNVNVNLFLIPSIPKFKAVNGFFRFVIGKFLFSKLYSNFDLIHVHSYLASPLALNIKKTYSIPMIITEHSSYLLRNNIDNYDFKLAQTSFKLSDLNIGVSSKFSKVLSNKFKANFEVVYNTIDTCFFKETEVVKAHDSYRFLTVGNLVESKNHELLLKAFSKSLAMHKFIYLDIIGDGPLKNNLEQLIIDLDIEKNVTLHGYLTREEVFSCLNGTDCFVMPSIHETFCISLVEAMACGKPVIANDFGGVISDLPPLTDLMISENSMSGYSNLMNKVVQLNVRNSRTNSNAAYERFSVEVFFAKYREIYEKIS